jgi:integrase
VWKTRYWRYLDDGTKEHPWEVFGSEEEFRNKADVKDNPKYKNFIDRINVVRVVVDFADLCRMFIEEEIPKRVPHGQISSKGFLCYLADRWGQTRLDQLIQMKYEINNWLQGDMPLRSDKNPDEKRRKQASWQTRKHIRRLLVEALTYAVDKKYLPYNPFTGTAISVKNAGAAPVDRSEFFITPEQFRWMLNDPETPGHVKVMILLAYTVGLRTSEMLGMRWDEIEFDGSEPRIRIQRSMDGKNVNTKAKNRPSRTWVPMCSLVGARLLAYKETNPSTNGWIFESWTGRPIHDDSLREDHLRPALWRMAAKFKIKRVPEGTGFHAFRHAYNALIEKVSGSPEEIRKIQMKLLRQADESTNKKYGMSSPIMREKLRATHTAVAELALGIENE